MTQESSIVENTTPETEIIDLVQIPPNQNCKSFWYKVTPVSGDPFHVTILAITSTGAQDALNQQFSGAGVGYLGCSEIIMQFNG
jgi:hypothetical protein